MKALLKENEKIVLYLYNYFFKSTLKNDIVSDIKQIFIKLIKYYNYKLGGVYNVLVYENLKYGTILEIEKKDELLFNPDLIDIKVKIYKDTNFYFKTNDYFILEEYKNIYYDNNNYYINILDIDNLNKVLEFGEIIYSLAPNFLDEKIFIK